MFLLSNVFDPRYAFLIYAPLMFCLDRYTGRKVMWVTVIAEWSNQILKWLMHGERPYWWVHEYGQGQSEKFLPPIEQTFMTCETGPGSPSGHSMATAAVWYIMIEGLLRRRGNESKNSLLNSVCWSVYTLGLCAVSLSRIYLAAHFPHQCLLGMIMGIAVAMLVSNVDTDSLSRRGYAIGTVCLIGSAMLTYAVLLATGLNPHWSVERALKWCAKREHVHLDTTPFFSMMRYTGFFLGMGLGLHSNTYRQSSNIRFDGKMKLASILLSLAASKAIEKVPIPASLPNPAIYTMVFTLNMILPFVFIGLIPYLISKIMKPSTSVTTKSQ